MRFIRGLRRLAGVALALGAGYRSLAAQAENNHLYDRFQVDLSGTGVILGSNLRVDGSQGNGTDINAEDVLGLAKVKLQPRASLRWRMARRHELEAGYQFARRSGDKTLTRDFVFGDSTYTAGLRIKSAFNTDQAFLTYRFAFLAHDRTQVGLGVGLGAFFFKTGIDALGSIAGNPDSVTSTQEKSFIGPTATLGLYGRFLSGDHWYFEGDLRGVAVKIDRFKASIVELGGAARYYVSSTVGIEAGYGVSAVNVTVSPKANPDRSSFSGKVKYTLQSVRLGVAFSL